jgi:YD repeat-containing protein
LRVSYAYDEGGRRVRKTDHGQNFTTYYAYDASGSVLAIYDNNGSALQQKEVPVYASGRLGMYYRQANSYQYELTDWVSWCNCSSDPTPED